MAYFSFSKNNYLNNLRFCFLAVFPGVLNWQRKLWLTVQEFRAARLAVDTLESPPDLQEVEEKMRDSRNTNLRAISISYRVTHQFNQVVARMQGLTGELRVCFLGFAVLLPYWRINQLIP